MLEVAQKYLQLKSGEYYKCFGKVDKVVGLTIESIGPKAKLNDLCMIFLDKERRDYVMSEVVGFKDSHIILMPFDNVEGVGVGCIVENTGHPLTVAVGDELLGHTVDGIGRVTDCDEKDLKLDSEYPIEAPPPDPMSREIISDVLPLGVKAVDGLITVGKGQRIGIFAGSGVGKSTLLGMFARNTKADINVIVQKGDQQAGLVVDNLIGQQEIVIKSLGKYINGNKLISGATILGDGDVALILDVNTLM